MKTFKFSLVLRTRENTDVFITLDDNIYGIHSKRVNILYLSILLLSLQWVLKKSKKDFLRYIGYRNFINDLIKHVSLLILVHVRLLFCPNC